MVENVTHVGQKIARIRELFGMKQEALAIELGISQQAVSKLEKCEMVDDVMLERIAAVFSIPSDAIRHFCGENILKTIIGDHAAQHLIPVMTFNPIEKLIEAYAENIRLYERRNMSCKKEVAR